MKTKKYQCQNISKF